MSTVLKILILFAIGFLALDLQGQSESGEVRYVRSPQNGLLTLQASGYGKKKAIAFKDASIKAFQVLLKSGVPGSNQYLPLLGGDSRKVYQEKEVFFQQFFDNDTYLEFLVDQHSGEFRKRARKTDPNIIVVLTINVVALRQYMESTGVVRKFGI